MTGILRFLVFVGVLHQQTYGRRGQAQRKIEVMQVLPAVRISKIVMKKFHFILVINLLFNISVYCQGIDLIRIDSIYSECGVIFPGSYKLSIELSGLTTRFTPTIEEV